MLLPLGEKVGALPMCDNKLWVPLGQPSKDVVNFSTTNLEEAPTKTTQGKESATLVTINASKKKKKMVRTKNKENSTNQ